MSSTRSDISTRLARPGDAGNLRDLAISSFVAAFGSLYSERDLQAFLTANYTLESWRHAVVRADRPVWVAETPQGKLSGYAQASPCDLPVDPMPDGALQLRRLYVDPDTLSAGIGATLMQCVIDWVEAQGRPPLFLGVWSGNAAAQRFYARHGFLKVGEYDFPVGERVDRDHILRRD
ncbi:GNAT family N-acetyltransferase [Hyphomonas johnsonii]|uniref:Histone acetyltransferase HPA2 n=1 Tax=Hyphomonas johnsonii MHS-2 TaxID=1280950 RepID=A0A059FCN3_9PROT|nr:GNAT family N-acetyltransferase [Hyphomonas johnsonii]KCZ88306.1 Histone acetyltransferase HPA2 [Hyphomonas johnsonii MHS-2]